MVVRGMAHPTSTRPEIELKEVCSGASLPACGRSSFQRTGRPAKAGQGCGPHRGGHKAGPYVEAGTSPRPYVLSTRRRVKGKQLYPRFCFIRHLSRSVSHGDACSDLHRSGIAATGPDPLFPPDPAHLPCSRLDIHPAAIVSNDAGSLLHYRFTPYLGTASRTTPTAGILSVAVVVILPEGGCPDLLFHQATWPELTPGRRVGKFLYPLAGTATDHLPALHEPPGNRTLNPQLKRLLLCQLS